MDITYGKGYLVYRGPRRRPPRGPQPQNWQTNIQKITNLKDLEFMISDGCKAEAFRIGGPVKCPVIPVKVEGVPGFLHFAYAGTVPDDEDIRKNGIIAIAYAKYYQGLPICKLKPTYQQEILRQVLESSGYQIFKHKYERKIKLRSMHSD